MSDTKPGDMSREELPTKEWARAEANAIIDGIDAEPIPMSATDDIARALIAAYGRGLRMAWEACRGCKDAMAADDDVCAEWACLTCADVIARMMLEVDQL